MTNKRIKLTGGQQIPNLISPPFSSLRRLDIILTGAVLILLCAVILQFIQINKLSTTVQLNTPKIVVMDNETDVSGLDVPVLPLEELK